MQRKARNQVKYHVPTKIIHGNLVEVPDRLDLPVDLELHQEVEQQGDHEEDLHEHLCDVQLWVAFHFGATKSSETDVQIRGDKTEQYVAEVLHNVDGAVFSDYDVVGPRFVYFLFLVRRVVRVFFLKLYAALDD